MTYLECLHHLSYIILLLCLCLSYHGSAGKIYTHTSFLAVPGPILLKSQDSYDLDVLLCTFSRLITFLMDMKENEDKQILRRLVGWAL